jgi:hypothetical protein
MARATPEQAKAGMDARMSWAGKASSAIVDLGAPLGSGRHVESGSNAAGRTQARGYSILEGGSIDEILRVLDGHLHLICRGIHRGAGSVGDARHVMGMRRRDR